MADKLQKKKNNLYAPEPDDWQNEEGGGDSGEEAGSTAPEASASADKGQESSIDSDTDLGTQLKNSQDRFRKLQAKEADLGERLSQRQQATDRSELAEKLGHAITQLGAGLYGSKHNVDLSNIQFDKTDWEKKRDRDLGQYEKELADVRAERTGELGLQGKLAAASMRNKTSGLTEVKTKVGINGETIMKDKDGRFYAYGNYTTPLKSTEFKDRPKENQALHLAHDEEGNIVAVSALDKGGYKTDIVRPGKSGDITSLDELPRGKDLGPRAVVKEYDARIKSRQEANDRLKTIDGLINKKDIKGQVDAVQYMMGRAIEGAKGNVAGNILNKSKLYPGWIAQGEQLIEKYKSGELIDPVKDNLNAFLRNSKDVLNEVNAAEEEEFANKLARRVGKKGESRFWMSPENAHEYLTGRIQEVAATAPQQAGAGQTGTKRQVVNPDDIPSLK